MAALRFRPYVRLARISAAQVINMRVAPFIRYRAENGVVKELKANRK